MPRRFLVLRLCLLCLPFLAACEQNECRPEAHECDGNVARNCVTEFSGSEHYVLSEYDCGEERCVDGESNAFCALADTSHDAECKGAEDSNPLPVLCSGNATLSCSDGYAVSVSSCAENEVCLSDHGWARCEVP